VDGGREQFTQFDFFNNEADMKTDESLSAPQLPRECQLADAQLIPMSNFHEHRNSSFTSMTEEHITTAPLLNSWFAENQTAISTVPTTTSAIIRPMPFPLFGVNWQANGSSLTFNQSAFSRPQKPTHQIQPVTPASSLLTLNCQESGLLTLNQIRPNFIPFVTPNEEQKIENQPRLSSMIHSHSFNYPMNDPTESKTVDDNKLACPICQRQFNPLSLRSHFIKKHPNTTLPETLQAEIRSFGRKYEHARLKRKLLPRSVSQTSTNDTTPSPVETEEQETKKQDFRHDLGFLRQLDHLDCLQPFKEFQTGNTGKRLQTKVADENVVMLGKFLKFQQLALKDKNIMDNIDNYIGGLLDRKKYESFFEVCSLF